MSTHANRVKMTVTSVASSGTGDITLNAASTGFRSFATAYGANATVDILITEGTAWEIARNCTYTHSGTTVSRGTLENSSTGSAVVFTADAVVSVIASAAFGNNAALNHVAASPTTAGVTGVVGTMHLLDISGLTASRNFTLPATAAVGDRVGVYLTTGDASYELIIIGDTGDTINGGSANTEWSRLFITNECVILRCVTANAAWVVEYDGRIPCLAGMLKTTNTNVNDVTATKIALNEVIVDNCSVCDSATNNRFNIRRTGTYKCTGKAGANTANIASHQTRTHKDGTFVFNQSDDIAAYAAAPPSFGLVAVNAGQYLELYYYHNSADNALRTYYGASGDDAQSMYIEELL